MRALLLIPVLVLASPAIAHQSPPQAYAGRPEGPAFAVPPEIMDRRLPDQLGRRAGAVMQALMDLPVGELQAAIEGRPVTPRDRHHTIGAEVGPGAARHAEQAVTSKAQAVQSTARAIQSAIPALQQAIGQILAAVDAGAANLPSSAYPRR